MLLLVDTHVLLALTRGEEERLPQFIREALQDRRNTLFASVVSLWEAAIKHRIGKLDLPGDLERWPAAISALAIATMDIVSPHVLAEADPVPRTNDPFDRLLLAICQVEAMRLVTLDKVLLAHPLALQPASA